MKIVGFGNSLTHGYLVNRGYLNFLQDNLPLSVEIINSGIPGDTIIDGFGRLESSVLKYNPDITVIEFAVNDAFAGIPVHEFEKYYLYVLKKIKRNKIIMIPHTLFYQTDERIVKPYYDKLKEISDKNNLLLINVSKYKLSKDELLGDKLHPNENGYKVYAKEAYNVLKEIVNGAF